MYPLMTIAHLSDLHFGNHDATILDHLEEQLTKRAPPDVVIVSGDLSDHSRKSELTAARDYLQRIMKRLAAKRGKPARLIIVPGNHDVGYFRGRRAWQKVFGPLAFMPQAARLPGMDDYYRRQGFDEAAAKYRATLDGELCEFDPEFGVTFFKFDSNNLPLRLTNYAQGCVGEAQRRQIVDVIGRCEEHYKQAFIDSRKIAVVHHHLHYLPDADSDSLLLMKDAGVFWRWLIEHKVDLVLHGHKHYATHVVLRYMRPSREPTDGQQLTVEERESLVLSAGSAAHRRPPPTQSYSYYHIDCKPFLYTVRKYRHAEISYEEEGPELTFKSVPRLYLTNLEAPLDDSAMQKMLIPQDDDIDPVHHFKLIHIFAYIEQDLSLRNEYRFVFSNVSDRPSQCLNISIVLLDAPNRIDQMDFTAQDGAKTVNVEVRLVSTNKVQFRVSYSQMQPNNGSRSIVVKFRIPKAMWRKNDFDAFGLSRFVKGVDKFEYELRSHWPLVEPRFFSARPSGFREVPLDDNTPTKEGDWHYVRPQITNRSDAGCGLLMHYRALDCR